jgi:large subunit ribosomal protein L29
MMAKKPVTAASGSKVEDMRTKTDDQLYEQLVDLKREAFNLRFQSATNQLERPARIREVRRDIARIKTLQNERSATLDRGQGETTRSAEAK